jgi:hypothetical protein
LVPWGTGAQARRREGFAEENNINLPARAQQHRSSGLDGAAPLCPAFTGRTEPEFERGPIHFHMLILDGVSLDRLDDQLDFTGSVRRPLNLLWVFETGRSTKNLVRDWVSVIE